MRSIAGVALWKWIVLAAAVALLVVAFLVSGSSSSTVATVDGKAITLTDYNGWLKAAAVSAHESESEVPSFVPDAPNYTRCIAFVGAALKKSSSSSSASQSTLRTDCSEIRVTLAEEVMQFLLDGQWFLDEGSREGVAISSAQVEKTLHTSFPKSSGLTEFLSSSGLSKSDLEFEARAALVAEKLSAAHSGPTPTITSAEISSYYNENKSDMDGETLQQATSAIREELIEEAQAPTFDKWMSTVQKYFQPRTTCAPGYRIAYYCAGAAT